jgi:hypothetical protein
VRDLDHGHLTNIFWCLDLLKLFDYVTLFSTEDALDRIQTWKL